MPEEKNGSLSLKNISGRGNRKRRKNAKYGRLQSDCRMSMVSKLLITCWIQPKDILREK